jgi:GT2 family glycosyltransferase
MLPLPKVYIIVLNYKSWPDTLECLESLMKLDYPDYQVVVVDNQSPNRSLNYIQQWASGTLDVSVPASNPLRSLSCPAIPKPLPYTLLTRSDLEDNQANPTRVPFVLIDAGENLGYSGGNNLGIQYALRDEECAYIWVLNNDTVVEPSALRFLVEKMATCAAQHQKVGILGCKVMHYYQPTVIQGAGGSRLYKWLGYATGLGNGETDAGQYDVEQVAVDYINGCSMFTSREFIDQVGLLSEDYFLYFEEPDWAVRGRRSGKWELGYAWRAKIYHKEGASIGGGTHREKSSISKFSDFYWARSKILFTRKFYPYCLPTLYAGLSLAILNRIRRGQWDRVPMLMRVMLNPLPKYRSSDQTPSLPH